LRRFSPVCYCVGLPAISPCSLASFHPGRRRRPRHGLADPAFSRLRPGLVPSAAKRWCAGSPSCRNFASKDGRCPDHQRSKERTSSEGWHHLYSAAWQRYRRAYLQAHPLCVLCRLRDGTLTPARIVDHVRPHRGDHDRFWDPDNHQAVCKPCHDRKTATEDGGFGNRRK
jgi:5-methylcytosine-specific restriction protein A